MNDDSEVADKNENQAPLQNQYEKMISAKKKLSVEDVINAACDYYAAGTADIAK